MCAIGFPSGSTNCPSSKRMSWSRFNRMRNRSMVSRGKDCSHVIVFFQPKMRGTESSSVSFGNGKKSSVFWGSLCLRNLDLYTSFNESTYFRSLSLIWDPSSICQVLSFWKIHHTSPWNGEKNGWCCDDLRVANHWNITQPPPPRWWSRHASPFHAKRCHPSLKLRTSPVVELMLQNPGNKKQNKKTNLYVYNMYIFNYTYIIYIYTYHYIYIYTTNGCPFPPFPPLPNYGSQTPFEGWVVE